LADILSLSELSSSKRKLTLATTTRAQRIAIVLLVAAVLAELIVWAVLPFNGYDSYSHVFWIGEWHKLWDAGIFYPRWMPDSFGGFGAPSFYFYPPLTFFFSSALYAVLPQLTAPTIGKLLSFLITFGSGATFWLYLKWRVKENRNSTLLVLASLLYAFAPYRFFDYSVRGAISEHLAFVWLPLIFFGCDLIAERRRQQDTLRGFALLTVSLALLGITNLPTTTLVGISLVIYAFSFNKDSRNRLLITLIVAAAAFVLLDAFYFYPLVSRFSDVQLNRLWRPASIFLNSPFTALFTGENITINIVTLTTLVGLGWLLVAREMPQRFRWLLVIIVFLQLPYISYFLFHVVPPFTIVQLSYRFFIIVILVVAIQWYESFRDANQKIASCITIFWSVVVLCLSFQLLAGVHVHKYGDWPVGEAPEYATRWEPPYTTYGASLNYIAMLSAPFHDSTQNVISNNANIISAKRTTYSDTIDCNTPVSTRFIFRRTWWPTWKATVDGQSTIIFPDTSGRLALATAPGTHRIILWLESENPITTGGWISLSALVLLSVSLVGFHIRSNRA
jgi:hypothetical protein